MASSYSNESINAVSQSSSSSEEQLVMDQRKRKRMISNRESARRSRMRKQQHQEDLTAQLVKLRAENSHLTAAVGATAQLYVAMEAENSVLRAQAAELAHRLQSLNEIISYLNAASFLLDDEAPVSGDGSFMMNNNPWSESAFVAQPLGLMAPADILMY